jgi:hypothetical protein
MSKKKRVMLRLADSQMATTNIELKEKYDYSFFLFARLCHEKDAKNSVRMMWLSIFWLG